MEKDRSVKIISLIALVVAVLCLTIAFAAMSTTLTINGTAEVNTAKWDIHFANLSEPEITGDASVEGTPTITDTLISGYKATITKPGDKVVYSFDIVNDGTIDAKIGAFSEPEIETISNVAKMIVGKYPMDLTYDINKDGVINSRDVSLLNRAINCGLYYEDEVTKVKIGDTLNAGETKKAKLIIEYRNISDVIPDFPVKLYENADTVITYIQAD